MNRYLVSYLESRAEVISADSYSLNDFNVFDFVKDGELVASVSGKTFNFIKVLSLKSKGENINGFWKINPARFELYFINILEIFL